MIGTVLTFRYRIVVGAQMDLSGRFNFWRMLLHTRAITPPRAMAEPRWQFATLLTPRWLVLTVIVALSVGAVWYVRTPPSKSVVVGQATTPITYPTRPSQSW